MENVNNIPCLKRKHETRKRRERLLAQISLDPLLEKITYGLGDTA